MDLYRYFHPHHNPRLQKVALRLQELGELEQAAIELTRAVKRAEIRSKKTPVVGLNEESFSQVLEALDFVSQKLAELTRAHPGDDVEAMAQLLQERKEAPGWETWSRLLKQRLRLLNQYENISAA